MEEKNEDKALTYLVMAGLTYEQIEGVKALGFLNAPASKSHHLNYPGGLVRHSLNVTDNILKLTETFGYKWQRKESPYVIGMLHDLVKCKCYEDVLGSYDFVDPGWPGHGVASLGIAAVELGIKLTYEEAMAITHHMGLWGLSEEGIKDFNKALTNNAAPIIITHTADWWAARIDEAEAGKDRAPWE
jgi:hypothetical protein